MTALSDEGVGLRLTNAYMTAWLDGGFTKADEVLEIAEDEGYTIDDVLHHLAALTEGFIMTAADEAGQTAEEWWQETCARVEGAIDSSNARTSRAAKGDPQP